jgi:hypothetical protein
MTTGLLGYVVTIYGLVPAGIHWLLLGTPAWWTTPAGVGGVVSGTVVLGLFYWSQDVRWFIARWRAAGTGDPMPKRGPDLPNPWWLVAFRLVLLAGVMLLAPVDAISEWLYGTVDVVKHGWPLVTLVATVPAYVWLVRRYLRWQVVLRREQASRAAKWSITFGPEARMFIGGQEVPGRPIIVRGTGTGVDVEDGGRLIGLQDWRLDMSGTVDADAAGVFEAWPLRSRDPQPSTHNDDDEKTGDV